MKKRYLLTVSAILIVLLITAVVAVLIIPTVREILDLTGRINRERVTVETRYFQRQKVRKTIEYVSEVKEKLPTLQETVLERGKEVSFVEKIENLAAANGLQEKLRLIPPEGGPSDMNRHLTAEITLVGDPQRIGKFLSDLERSDPLFIATNLSFERNEKTNTVLASLSGWIAWPDAEALKI